MSTIPASPAPVPPAREHTYGFRPSTDVEDGRSWTVTLKHNHDDGILLIHDEDGTTLLEARLPMTCLCPTVAVTAPAPGTFPDPAELEDGPVMFVVTAQDGQPDIFTAHAKQADTIARLRGGVVGCIPMVADYRRTVGKRMHALNLVPIAPRGLIQVQLVTAEELRAGDVVMNPRTAELATLAATPTLNRGHYHLYFIDKAGYTAADLGQRFIVVHPRGSRVGFEGDQDAFLTNAAALLGHQEPEPEPEPEPVPAVEPYVEACERYAAKMAAEHGADASRIVRETLDAFGFQDEHLIARQETLIEAVDRAVMFTRPPVPESLPVLPRADVVPPMPVGETPSWYPRTGLFPIVPPTPATDAFLARGRDQLDDRGHADVVRERAVG